MDFSSISNLSAHAGAPAEPAAPQPAGADQRALIQAVKAVNAAELFGSENELSFVLDRNTRRAVARIVNRETGEVVKHIPLESVLQMALENGRR
jgi:uncharacterized FlaG/YvyC family protein